MNSDSDTKFINLDDFIATHFSPEEIEKTNEDSEKMSREGLPHRDGFAHYAMYTDENGISITHCLYIGIARSDDIEAAKASIRLSLGCFTVWPPETDWQLHPDEETQQACIETWTKANSEKNFSLGTFYMTSV